MTRSIHSAWAELRQPGGTSRRSDRRHRSSEMSIGKYVETSTCVSATCVAPVKHTRRQEDENNSTGFLHVAPPSTGQMNDKREVKDCERRFHRFSSLVLPVTRMLIIHKQYISVPAVSYQKATERFICCLERVRDWMASNQLKLN